MLQNNPYIIFDADPFCFGPISTTLNIVEQLRTRKRLRSGTKIILLGTLTSTQLSHKSNLFDQIYECDTTSCTALSHYTEIIAGAKLYITNTNPNSINFVSNLGIPIIYIDTLFWMWDSLPVDLRHIEKTFIQNFHGVEFKIAKFHSKLGNYQVVPPIIHSSVYQYMMDPSESDGILITLGGIDTVYADTSDFYFHFLQDLLTISNLNQEPNITIAGGGNTINKLANLFAKTHPHIKISCLERQDFLQRLHHARKVLANPGLTTFYECTILNKDVFFLPPQNYSQQLQLEIYLKNYYSNEYGFLWSREYGYPDIPADIPEKEGIRLIQECQNLFISNSKERQRSIDMINIFLKKEKSKTNFNNECFKNNENNIIANYIENRI
ncbi:hypothetical protein ACNFJN_08095 [Xenorhabdus budapestensis]|uniref:hypothetical protein n=1 Tax=Xenorhabdus budapestensis TaxID=290110 RepID=UPI003A8C297E